MVSWASAESAYVVATHVYHLRCRLQAHAVLSNPVGRHLYQNSNDRRSHEQGKGENNDQNVVVTVANAPGAAQKLPRPNPHARQTVAQASTTARYTHNKDRCQLIGQSAALPGKCAFCLGSPTGTPSRHRRTRRGRRNWYEWPHQKQSL